MHTKILCEFLSLHLLKNLAYFLCNQYHDGSCPTIQCLLDVILVKILEQVGSVSFIDLYNMRLSCKNFLEVSHDDVILDCVNLEIFPYFHGLKMQRLSHFSVIAVSVRIQKLCIEKKCFIILKKRTQNHEIDVKISIEVISQKYFIFFESLVGMT